LPYVSAEVTRPITVYAVTVTLDPLPAYVKAGETVTFTGQVLRDGTPWAGQEVAVMILLEPGVLATSVARGTTDAEGKFSLSWTVPWTMPGTAGKVHTLPCNTWEFYAVHLDTFTNSARRSMAIAFPTRISISAPDRVAPGETFTISGVLEYESASGVWSPLADRTVSLYYNGTHITDVTTGSDGSYSKPDARIPEAGTYTLRAVFAGEGLGLAPAFTLQGLSIAAPPELAPLAQYALAALPLILVGGGIAYSQLVQGR